MFSPLKPTMLNNSSGKHKKMNMKIFIFILNINKLNINQTKEYHTILSIAVE